MATKRRIDQLLVDRGLVDSRENAKRLILAGQVFLAEQPVQKAGQMVDPGLPLRIAEGLKYVSRGGLKLEAALDAFSIVCTGIAAVDVGASPGGFTDCLLQRGARRVYAVDVGYGQIAWKLRQDPRVVVMERTNARYLAPDAFPEPIDMAVIDVSFIGADKVLEPLAAITGRAVVLLKPQFQAGPENVPRGGVIRDPQVHRRVLLEFHRTLAPWAVLGLTRSPITGSSGNSEFLLHLTTDPEGAWDPQQYQKKVEELIA